MLVSVLIVKGYFVEFLVEGFCRVFHSWLYSNCECNRCLLSIYFLSVCLLQVSSMES